MPTPAVEPAVEPSQAVGDHLVEQVRAWEEAQGLVGLGAGEVTQAPSARTSDLAEELHAVRQRLAYYERFDSLINDSVQRSADLFQALFAEREAQRRDRSSAESEATAAAHAEAERQMAAERRGMHGTLMALMNDAGRLQRQVDGLIEQIAEAVTGLTSRHPATLDGPLQGA